MNVAEMRRIAPLVIAAAFGACATGASGPAPIPPGAQTMKAIVYHEYGTADVLRLEEVAIAPLEDNHVLVKVHAAAANPLDWHLMRGSPYVARVGEGLRRPAIGRLGVDMSGEVVAVGKAVTKFKVGDEVFGTGRGSFGEYVRAREHRIALKPANISWEEAAAVPVAAITALQALRDQGKVKAGQKVLINGASGGVGTYAVQLAKALGAEVTGVCSTRNVELVRSLGADHVVDYTQEDFTTTGEKYDVIIDNVGTRALHEVRRALTGRGTLVVVGGGGPDRGNWIGALSSPIKAFFYDPFVSQDIRFFMAEITPDDLSYIGQLMEQGKVKSVIDRRYSLAETPDAIRYLEGGHARGKVVIVP